MFEGFKDFLGIGAEKPECEEKSKKEEPKKMVMTGRGEVLSDREAEEIRKKNLETDAWRER